MGTRETAAVAVVDVGLKVDLAAVGEAGVTVAPTRVAEVAAATSSARTGGVRPMGTRETAAVAVVDVGREVGRTAIVRIADAGAPSRLASVTTLATDANGAGIGGLRTRDIAAATALRIVEQVVADAFTDAQARGAV